MSTKRVINGVEYTVPPGTEHIWTPEGASVVSAVPPGLKAIDVLDGLKVQAIVRNQNEQQVKDLVAKVVSIYQSFLDKKINTQQLADQMGTFRNTDLMNLPPAEVDDLTIQNFENAILFALAESTT